MRSLLFFCLALAACQSTPAAKPTPTDAPWLVMLSRSGCEGRCPSYEVRAYDDGRVEFEPQRDTVTSEKTSAQLSPEQLAALKQRLEAAPFGSWKKTYDTATTTDLPTVRVGYRGHVILHMLGDESAPRELVELERDLDALLNTSPWVTGKGAPEK